MSKILIVQITPCRFSSKILNRILSDLKIPEQKVDFWYLTKARLSFAQKKQCRVPVEQIRRRASKYNSVLLVGDRFISQMFSKLSLEKYRGTVFSEPESKYVCTHDPFDIVRGEALKYRMIKTDLDKVWTLRSHVGTWQDTRKFLVNKTCKQSLVWLEKMLRVARYVAYDIEFTHNRISSIAFSYHASEALCVPVMQYRPEEEVLIWDMMNRIVTSDQIQLVTQNGNFDNTALEVEYKIQVTALTHDTMIAHGILYPEYKKGLDFLTSMYTMHPYYKDEGKQWRAVSDWYQFWEYNAKDASVTLEVFLELKKRLHVSGQWKQYLERIKLLPVLQSMQTRGWATDKDNLGKAKEEINTAIRTAYKALDILVQGKLDSGKLVLGPAQAELEKLKYVDEELGIVGHLNVNSSKQLIEYFYTMHKIKPYTSKSKASKSGVSVDELALKRLRSAHGLEEASLVQRIIELKKYRDTYLNLKFSADGRFRSFFKPVGTGYGRFSAGKFLRNEGTNIQNLPSQYKQFLRADTGKLVVELDKKGAEWVVVAYLASEPNMIRILENDLDAHSETAKLITGLSIEFIREEARLLGHTTNVAELAKKRAEIGHERYAEARIIPSNMSLRQLGKRSNHALNYGMKAGLFALENGISQAEAQKIVDLYHDAYPGIKEVFWSNVQEALGKTRTLRNCWNQSFRLYDKWSEDLLKKAYSILPQSTVVELLNKGLRRGFNDKALNGIQFLSQNHDSITFQGTASVLRHAIPVLQRYIETPCRYNGKTFVIKTECLVGRNWKHTREVDLYKDFETGFNKVIKELS